MRPVMMGWTVLGVLVPGLLVAQSPLVPPAGPADAGLPWEGAAACTIEVSPAVSLGELADERSLTTAARVDVAPLPDGGGWVVADLDAEWTLRYGSDGDYRGEYLGHGQGPGEIQAPARVTLDGTDSLWVSQARGRAVVLSAAGETRTITSPEQLGVDGHTPSGLPFAMQFWPPLDDAGMPVVEESLTGAVVMDREGNRLYELGPVGGVPEAERGPIPNPTMVPMSLAALGDSVVLGPAPTDPDVWVERWTPEGGEPLVSAEAIREALGDQVADLEAAFEGQTMGLRAAPGGRVWGLGRVTALPADDADRLRAEVAEELGEETPNISDVRYHPHVANRAHGTVLYHMLPDGTVTGALLREGMPRGFVGPDHYFTLDVAELGLLVVRIWRFERNCEGA